MATLSRPGPALAATRRRSLRVATVAALAATLVLCGCAARPDPLAADSPAPGTTPELALYAHGQLLLRYPDGARGALLAANWPAPVATEGGEVHHTAVLAPADPAAAAGIGDGAETVRLLGPGDWESTMRALLASLAPDGAEGTGTMVSVHGRDIVVYRGPGGAPALVMHEAKPAALKVERSYGEQAFAAHALEHLRRGYGASAKLLFETTGDDGMLVFFDLASGQSVLLLREAPPSPQAAGEMVGFALRLSDALLLRSHVVSPLVRPFTSLGRLAWLTSQSAVTLLPRAPGEPEEPLIDGDAFFGALVQAIQDARESIDIRMYIFDRDDYALRIAELLRRRSHEVRVRIVLDYLGSLMAAQASGPRVYPYAGSASRGDASILEFLRRDSRIEVRASANPWRTGDHSKVVVVDRRVAFIGGMNVGHEYRYVWHDMMVSLRGPVVGRLARDFEQRWAHAGPAGDLAYAAAAASGEAFEGAAQSPDYVALRPLYTRTGDPQILRAQLAAMRRARSRIWVQQPYLSDDAVLTELIRARRRGVDVRVILPSHGDSGFMNGANLVTANAFLRHGIRVYAFPGMTHVKAALYDGWACVGSANFDKLSLRVNQETNVATSDPRFVARLERELFERDFARSAPVLEPRAIGWPAYFASFVAGQL